jgi:hypothetical protein
MGRTPVTVSRLEEHPNLPEVLGVLAQLAHIGDDHLVALADSWVNSPSLSEARDRALSPESPLVVEVLAAFDALGALFADDLSGEADYVIVESAVTVRALKAVRDAIAAAYARPVLSKAEHAALLRPWRIVFPQPTVEEPDLGPRAEQVKALLSTLPRLSARCHDADGRALFEALVDRSFVAEADRASAAEAAFQAAVLTSRRRVWALVRRTGTEGLLRPCLTCRVDAGPDREAQRVLELCLDAACALLVADAVPDSCTELLADSVLALIPAQRQPDPTT